MLLQLSATALGILHHNLSGTELVTGVTTCGVVLVLIWSWYKRSSPEGEPRARVGVVGYCYRDGMGVERRGSHRKVNLKHLVKQRLLPFGKSWS